MQDEEQNARHSDTSMMRALFGSVASINATGQVTLHDSLSISEFGSPALFALWHRWELQCDYVSVRVVTIVKTRLVQIGNSRGVRIPKPLIEQADLGEEVELRIEDGVIIIEASRSVRAGWADAARTVRDQGEAGLLDEPTPTRFDETEWEW